MTKANQILDYIDDNPETSQTEVVRELGFSRQLVSQTIHRRGIKLNPAPVKILPSLPCIYCTQKVTSVKYVDGKPVQCTYHKACAYDALRYKGNCPVCGEYFERVGSQVKRDRTGRSIVGQPKCSWACRGRARRKDFVPILD